ncbi:MAG TPA: hypothetical protein VIK68_07205 [Sphingomicrobium sp.]
MFTAYLLLTAWAFASSAAVDPPPQGSPKSETVTGSRLPVAAGDLPFTNSLPGRIFSAPISDSDRESYSVAEKFGACLVKADPSSSMAFVMAAPGSGASQVARQKLKPFMERCFTTSVDQFIVGEISMTIQPTMARGVIAEALYRLQFADRPQPTQHISITVPASERDEAIVYEFAQCVTDANPASVRALILSKVSSHEEQSAISALMPSLSPCLYKGQTLKTDRLAFRARLAESLYRWSVSAGQSVAAAEQP